MAGCDIKHGRLYDDCQGRQVAGVKTVFFMPYSRLKIAKNLAGEITAIGLGNIYRFEQDTVHGQAIQEVVRGEGDTQFIRQQIELTIFYLEPEFMATITALKNGMWAIFYMDMDNQIRLMGEQSAMTQTGIVDQSGITAQGQRWVNLSFDGLGQAYAPFLEAFGNYPFDNFPDNPVVPPYVTLSGDLVYNDTGELYLANDAGDTIKYA